MTTTTSEQHFVETQRTGRDEEEEEEEAREAEIEREREREGGRKTRCRTVSDMDADIYAVMKRQPVPPKRILGTLCPRL